MNDKVYPKGIYFNKPRDGAKDFIIGSVSIDIESFDINTLKQYANGKYLRLNVLDGKEKPYMTVDTWKPEKKKEITIADVPFR